AARLLRVAPRARARRRRRVPDRVGGGGHRRAAPVAAAPDRPARAPLPARRGRRRAARRRPRRRRGRAARRPRARRWRSARGAMSAYVSLFVMSLSAIFFVVDPIGIVPLFLTMTAGDPPEKARRTARRACAVAGGLML